MASQEDVSPPEPHPSLPTVIESTMPPTSGELEEEDHLSGQSSPSSEDGNGPDEHSKSADGNNLIRPKLGSRKSSGTIIIPRDSPQVELREEEYDEGDARTMSPRRSSEEIEKMGQEARKALVE
jgi:short coiled-coil protein